MFTDDQNPPADQTEDAVPGSAENVASSDGQVSDITTESTETQAQAETVGSSTDLLESDPPTPSNYSATSADSGPEEFLLDCEEPPFASPIEALADFEIQVNKSLRVNEDLMMTYIFRSEISDAYYEHWRHEANGYFRNLCTFRLRQERMKARAAAKAGIETEPANKSAQTS